MIFDNLPDSQDPVRVKEEAIKRFGQLRAEVYKIVPEECLLKPDNVLTGPMVVVLSKDLIEQGLIEPEDICSLCLKKECIYNDVKDRRERIEKMVLLGGNQDLQPD